MALTVEELLLAVARAHAQTDRALSFADEWRAAYEDERQLAQQYKGLAREQEEMMRVMAGRILAQSKVLASVAGGNN